MGKIKKIFKETAKAGKATFDFLAPPPEKQVEMLQARKKKLQAQKELLKEQAEVRDLERKVRGSDTIFGFDGFNTEPRRKKRDPFDIF